MKVLFVSYYFPPLGGVASIRSLKYVKYLQTCEIEPVVLSCCPRWVRYPKDYQLLKELPKQIRVYRSASFDWEWIFKLLYGLKLTGLVTWLRQHLLVPDTSITWIPSARKMIDRIISENPQICLAFITAGPYSTLFLGKHLKNKHQIPFICEFRDEWTNNPERLNIRYPAAALRKELIWEAEILMNCSGIVYLTEMMKENFRSRYQFLFSRPCRVIPNGYDEEDFQKLEVNPSLSSQNTGEKVLRIVYSGSFYDRRQPDLLWEALVNLVVAGKVSAHQIRIDIYGKNTPNFVFGRYAQNKNLKQIVKLHKFLPHQQSIHKLMQADLLLLYIAGGKGTASIQTGKLFDYLRSGKPILAIIPASGTAADILNQSGLGIIADIDNPKCIERTLYDTYLDWQQGNLAKYTPDSSYIATYSRHNQAKSLAELFQEVVK